MDNKLAPLSIQDYLDASSDASKRSRTITIILVTASVLMLAGLLNSIQSQWMHRRMLLLGGLDRDGVPSAYTQSKIGRYPSRPEYSGDSAYSTAVDLYKRRYIELCGAVERAYVDSSFTIRVPFIGVVFDVNDLGLIGGVGFVVILTCYRFFLSREIDNLKISFDEAAKLGCAELEQFYKLLAMRQVFTVPRTPYIRRARILTLTPKLIVWCPLAVYLGVIYNDLRTAGIGQALQSIRYRMLVFSEALAIVTMILLSVMVTSRLVRMDRIWDACWTRIQANTPEEVHLQVAQVD